MKARMVARMLALALVAASAAARADEELRNWFDDPFFQISAALPDCPLPAGPFISDGERRRQAHRRVEKGTSCWLAGDCERPNAYAYDRDIAAALQAALRERAPLADSTLWVTVQGRVVFIEGCAAQASQAAALEALASALPYVQLAVAMIRSDPSARPPYPLRRP